LNKKAENKTETYANKSLEVCFINFLENEFQLNEEYFKQIAPSLCGTSSVDFIEDYE